MSRFPEQTDEPKRLFPKRAPSSSAQSTRRTVTGDFQLYCELMLRKISTPASTLRQPSSQPPFGTESMCPPISKHFSDSPRSVLQRFPASSRCVSTGNASSFLHNHARVLVHIAVKATRCAPFSSAVKPRSSLSSATVRLGFSEVLMVFNKGDPL